MVKLTSDKVEETERQTGEKIKIGTMIKNVEKGNEPVRDSFTIVPYVNMAERKIQDIKSTRFGKIK